MGQRRNEREFSARNPSGFTNQSGFTLVELLVVIAIIGILVGLLLPAVQQVREAARRTECSNNLKQQMTAMLNFESTNRYLPPGYSYPGQAMWSAHLMPFMEQRNLYHQLELDGPWTVDGSANEMACAVYVSQFQCPSSQVPEHAPEGEGQGIPNRVPSNYLGCASGLNNRESGAYPYYDDEQTADGVLYCNSKIKLRDITDGQSNTVMIGEAIFDYTSWGEDYSASLEVVDHWFMGSDQLTPTSPDNSTEASECLGSTACPMNSVAIEDAPINDKEMCFGSDHPAGAQFAFADGHIRFLSSLIDEEVYRAIGSRSNGEVVGELD